MSDKEIMEAPLTLSQCFLCNQWTPPEMLRVVILEGSDQEICVSCHRRLQDRIKKLNLELIKEAEESEPDEETAAAFGNSGRAEDGPASAEGDNEAGTIDLEGT